MSKSITRPKSSKKFKGLVAVLGSEQAAVAAWNKTHPDNLIGEAKAPALSQPVQELVNAGFTVEEAEKVLAESGEPAPPAPLTSKEKADALVAKNGMVPARGRVYSTSAIIEAQVRVLKTGKPEFVATEGTHRTKGVVIWRMDDEKSVAVQNLAQPTA